MAVLPYPARAISAYPGAFRAPLSGSAAIPMHVGLAGLKRLEVSASESGMSMNIRYCVEDLVAGVTSGGHLDVFENYYADDVVMC